MFERTQFVSCITDDLLKELGMAAKKAEHITLKKVHAKHEKEHKEVHAKHESAHKTMHSKHEKEVKKVHEKYEKKKK